MTGLLTGRAIVFTRHEVGVLADYVALHGAAQTYHVERDTEGVLWLKVQGGVLYRLSAVTT